MVAASALRRHGSIAPSGRGITLSALDHAHRYGRSLFPSRVFDPKEVARVLKDGHQSRKIGKMVVKGHRKGWPIYTLTLEERASCPRSCAAWSFCYGNNMQAAERIVHGDDLIMALLYELGDLQKAHPTGFLVRLHVLGDFWSADYVNAWRAFLDCYPALAVFGFTAHPRESEIGSLIAEIAENNWDRFAIRFSGARGELMAAQIGDDVDPMAIMCPAQTGATDCCATCALCWQTDRSIGFARH